MGSLVSETVSLTRQAFDASFSSVNSQLPNEILSNIASQCIDSWSVTLKPRYFGVLDSGIVASGIFEAFNMRLVSKSFAVGVMEGMRDSFSGTMEIFDEIRPQHIQDWVCKSGIPWLLDSTTTLKVSRQNHWPCLNGTWLDRTQRIPPTEFCWPIFKNLRMVRPVIRGYCDKTDDDYPATMDPYSGNDSVGRWIADAVQVVREHACCDVSDDTNEVFLVGSGSLHPVEVLPKFNWELRGVKVSAEALEGMSITIYNWNPWPSLQTDDFLTEDFPVEDSSDEDYVPSEFSDEED